MPFWGHADTLCRSKPGISIQELPDVCCRTALGVRSCSPQSMQKESLLGPTHLRSLGIHNSAKVCPGHTSSIWSAGLVKQQIDHLLWYPI